jgi:hypothetical protein
VANLCLLGLSKLREILLGSANAALAEIAARDGEHWKLLDEKSVLLHNVPAEVADQNRSTVYPAVYCYAARMENVLRQKFAAFSGPVRLVVDVRCTSERYEGLERELASYVEGVTTGLAAAAGSWGEHLIYSGGYTVKFEPAKLGGRNFIQSAKIELEVEACG